MGMKATQIRQTLQAAELLLPAVRLHQMHLEDQADVLALIHQRGHTMGSITLTELNQILNTYNEQQRSTTP